jgi:ferric-dicitrate binding protein FerR (iron transport regulator)
MNKDVEPADDLNRPRKRFRRVITLSAVTLVLVAALGALWMLHPWQVAQETSQAQTATVSQGDLVLGSVPVVRPPWDRSSKNCPRS